MDEYGNVEVYGRAQILYTRVKLGNSASYKYNNLDLVNNNGIHINERYETVSLRWPPSAQAESQLKRGSNMNNTDNLEHESGQLLAKRVKSNYGTQLSDSSQMWVLFINFLFLLVVYNL